MKTPIIVYNKMLPEFKRQAAQVIVEKLPGHSRAGRSAINRFLQKEHPCLSRWYSALLLGLLSAEDFSRLFSAIKAAFSLKELKSRGVGREQILEVVLLLIRLFKSLMINTSGALKNEEEKPAAPAGRKNFKRKEKLL